MTASFGVAGVWLGLVGAALGAATLALGLRRRDGALLEAGRRYTWVIVAGALLAVAVMVRSTEVPPQMFREGIGVVVEGTFDKSQVFSSNRLMVNHSNEYRAPKPGEEPRKWQETLEGSTTAANTTGAQ